MSIYFGSNPTNLVYNVPVNNTYTISYNVTGLAPTYVNFWFCFSSLPGGNDGGNGVVVGPIGPTSGNPTADWNRDANHATITSNIAQTTFYYPNNTTTDSVTGYVYNPLNDIRTVTIYGANSSYSNVSAICCQALALTGSATWGLVGEFNGWGATADIVMTQTSVGSGIFTAKLPYNPSLPSSSQFKFRISQNWAWVNYGCVSTTWPTGNIIARGANNITAPVLYPLEYYNITMNLNNLTYSSTFACFKEDTKILTNKGYILIQDLRKGDLVKTSMDGFKSIHMIGKKDIYHPASQERMKDQLYKCSPSEYPEVFEDLIMTGCHSILVDDFVNETQRQKTIDINGDTYVTSNKYRLPACADERATVYEIPGSYTIYHLALENDDYYKNYGIYANGLLVESCSQRYLKEISNMTLIE